MPAWPCLINRSASTERRIRRVGPEEPSGYARGAGSGGREPLEHQRQDEAEGEAAGDVGPERGPREAVPRDVDELRTPGMGKGHRACPEGDGRQAGSARVPGARPPAGRTMAVEGGARPRSAPDRDRSAGGGRVLGLRRPRHGFSGAVGGHGEGTGPSTERSKAQEAPPCPAKTCMRRESDLRTRRSPPTRRSSR